MAALCSAIGWYKKQHLSEETPAKPFLVCVRLRHWSLVVWENGTRNIHPISIWPDVGQLVGWKWQGRRGYWNGLEISQSLRKVQVGHN
ncbi:hypothetical protein TNCV_1548091 [Trichonephila clavipes]|nr:hypothetical protein TNCV_1548091 [Trichonephila clavipes]